MALSSAEEENRAALEGLIRALYVRNLLKQQGVELKIRIFSDSSAAIGHSRRQGNGKRMRHLEVHDMYIQQILKDGAAEICKINGTDNPADLFTKHLSRELIIKNMSRLGFRLLDDKNIEVGCKDLSQEINQEEEDEEEDHEELDQLIKHLNHMYYVPSLCSLLPTRETSVKNNGLASYNPESPVGENIGTVMSPSPIVKSSSANKPTAQEDNQDYVGESWVEVVRKSGENKTNSVATRPSISSAPTCSSKQVLEILKEATARAQQVVKAEERLSTRATLVR